MAVVPGIYRHFKGLHYHVLGVAQHSETGEELVVYVPLEEGGSKMFVRPVAMFVEEVDTLAGRVPRFAFVSQ